MKGLHLATLPAVVLGLSLVAPGCEKKVGCLDNCPVVLPPAPDRGPVTVTVDPSQALGPIVTGGGTNFTGFAGYVAPDHTRADRLAEMPYRLNRIHFSGEVPNLDSYKTEDRLNEHLPQPNPPPAAWSFSWLDGVVGVVKQVRDLGGADFILTIHNAPQWMTANAAVQGFLPRNPDDYATYCARLVSYYNKGSFIDDAGRTVTNPAGVVGIHYWEIWNEPDINDVGEGNDPVMSATEYAALFVKVTPAMRAVDPTIKIGGPNTISDHDDTVDYVNDLLATGVQVDFLAVHQYQASSAMPDAEAFAVASKSMNRPTSKIPLVISESNSDSEDTQTRTGSAFEWAAMPLEYKVHVELGTWRVLRWETYELNYNLVDALAGQVTTTYWAERTFWDAVPEGGTRVSCSASSPDVACLAALTPANKLDVTLINIGVASPDDHSGPGVKHGVDVQVAGAPRTFEVKVVDRDTAVETGPLASTSTGHAVAIDGYGIATLREQ